MILRNRVKSPHDTEKSLKDSILYRKPQALDSVSGLVAANAGEEAMKAWSSMYAPVCVCVRARERETNRDRDRNRERECVCVGVRERACARAREREREAGGGQRGRGGHACVVLHVRPPKERESVRVCVQENGRESK